MQRVDRGSLGQTCGAHQLPGERCDLIGHLQRWNAFYPLHAPARSIRVAC
jgi:hypothetical protein